MEKQKVKTITRIGVILLSVFLINGMGCSAIYNKNGNSINTGYDMQGEVVFPDSQPEIPVPTGDLTASSVVLLPNLHGQNNGFTCTGLAYDSANNCFLIGDIGALLPGETAQSQIVKMTTDFSEVIGTIPLYSTFPNMTDVQGVAFDTSNNSIWFCSNAENKIRNISLSGSSLGDVSVSRPTGIAYSENDDSFWVLTYDNNIVHINKSGMVLGTYVFQYNEALDQCFLDESRGLLYITAGANYSSRNNLYCFNISTHAQSIACTVDSYAVEGIWLGDDDKMIILNDGYYHSAAVDKNQVNIYVIP